VYASACLRELPGCLFVATNLDHADHIGNNRMMPGTGALVAALQVASGMEPVSSPASCAAAAAVLVYRSYAAALAQHQVARSLRCGCPAALMLQTKQCTSQH
jgi:ribonucleotide monophosphatase NagD (HAD superfamily)